MQFGKTVLALGALVASAVANNNPDTSSTYSSGAAVITHTSSSVVPVAVSTTVPADRITRNTNVNTALIVKTIYNTNVQTSTLPKSL